MTGLELSHPDERQLAVKQMSELMDGTKDLIQVDSCFIRKFGESYWVRQRISSLRGMDGKPEYLVVMVEDIDEQKRVQAELNESEQHFRVMLENSAIGISPLLTKKLGILEIIEAGDSETLIKTLEEYPLDIILLDWKLYGAPAPETCRLLLRAFPGMKIVLLSVNADDCQRAAAAGAEFIHKVAAQRQSWRFSSRG